MVKMKRLETRVGKTPLANREKHPDVLSLEQKCSCHRCRNPESKGVCETSLKQSYKNDTEDKYEKTSKELLDILNDLKRLSKSERKDIYERISDNRKAETLPSVVDAECLLWNLAGCNTIADAESPQEFNEESALPALHSVNRLARKYRSVVA